MKIKHNQNKRVTLEVNENEYMVIYWALVDEQRSGNVYINARPLVHAINKDRIKHN